WDVGEVHARQIPTNLGEGKYDINLLVRKETEGLSANWVYNADLFDDFMIEQMGHHLEHLLETFTSAPTLRVGQADLLRQEEKQRQIVDWNSTQALYPDGLTIHELF